MGGVVQSSEQRGVGNRGHCWQQPHTALLAVRPASPIFLAPPYPAKCSHSSPESSPEVVPWAGSTMQSSPAAGSCAEYVGTSYGRQAGQGEGGGCGTELPCCSPCTWGVPVMSLVETHSAKPSHGIGNWEMALVLVWVQQVLQNNRFHFSCSLRKKKKGPNFFFFFFWVQVLFYALVTR